MSTELLHIKISEIHENPIALRNVNKESEDYLGLVDSIRARGVMNPINVRRKLDPDTNEQYYELIDGLHRFSASMDAGLDTIPAQVLTLEDAEVLEAQIIGNVQRIDTKPVQYAQQLVRILSANPLMTEAELAMKLGKSPAWIGQRLGLTKISNEKIKELIDEGRIPLSNAYQIARLPDSEQLDFCERAQTESPDVFNGGVQQRVKEIREAHRQGREAAPAEFTATPHCQKISDLKIALEDGELASEIVRAEKAGTAEAGFVAAIKWVLHLDAGSVAAAKAKWDAAQASKKEAADRRLAERAAKKAAAAAKAASEAAALAEGDDD
jgi:ParB/RepB/Spo0J family partition protein